MSFDTISTISSSLRDRITACWLGKAVGGTLGMPFEGVSDVLDLEFYDPVPERMLPNDDLDLQVLWACQMSAMEQPRVDRHVLARAWEANIGFPFDEYGVAKRNIALGLLPPLTGSYDNWFSSGMGAAIRAEIWACLAAGDPELAADFAYEDACVDHAGEGIWAEVFLAALQSAAFVQRDPDLLLNRALSLLPESSLVRRAVADTRRWWRTMNDWRQVRQRIVQQYGSSNFTDVTMNVAFIVLGWLASEGDFGRAICTAVNCGMDTDCTGATVGALMGILDPGCISDRWLDPIGRDLVISKPIVGIDPPPSLEGLTELVLDLRQRLRGRRPMHIDPPQSLRHLALPATVGWLNVDRLPAPGSAAPSLPANAGNVRFPGTIGRLTPTSSTTNTAVLRFDAWVDHDCDVKVMFNTESPCRVWVDGLYAFGRDGGVMAPSFHRAPVEQISSHHWAAGAHEILAMVGTSGSGDAPSWVIGVGDARTNLWLPHALPRVGKR